MLKLLAVLALVSASMAHRYIGASWKQSYKPRTPYVYKSVTWDEAHEYEDCPEEDFQNDNYEEQEEGVGKDNIKAENGMHHFMSRHNPKLIEDICINKLVNVTIDGTRSELSVPVCPDIVREESEHCGFETVIIPAGKWIVIDIERSADGEFQIRNSYKQVYYDYRKPNSVRFMVPVILLWHLENGEKVRGEIATYIPEEHQSNPPPSKSDKVRVEDWDETKVYLRPYGGHREDKQFEDQYELLRKALTRANLSYKDNVELEAGYTYLRYGRQRIEAMLLAN